MTLPHLDRRLRTWQGVTVASLFLGYAGFYVCRSNLAVAGPLLQDPVNGFGFSKSQFGDMLTIGLFGYVLGKLASGPFADRIGGRAIFLLSLFASVIATVTMAFIPRGLGGSQPPALLLYLPLCFGWWLNRCVQATGWGGLVLTVGCWFPPNRIATVMGFLSMSYLLGDAAAKWYLGRVLSRGAGWEELFLISAGTLGIIGLAALIFLRPSPQSVGLPEFPTADSSIDESARSLFARYRPLLVNPSFLLVCLLSGGLTLIRESFNAWTPTYFHEAVGLQPGEAAKWSSVFPLVGAGASLLAGWTADRCGGRVSVVMIPSLAALSISLFVVPELPVRGNPNVAAISLGCVAAFLIMPYSFLAGAVAIRFGGRGGAATAANLIDTAGYLVGLLSGSLIGRIVERSGWNSAIQVLATVSAGCLAIAAIDAARRRKRNSPIRTVVH